MPISKGKVGPSVNGASAGSQNGRSSSTTQRRTWHSSSDIDTRRRMIHRIVEMLKAKKPNADETWTKKLPDMARRLEESLYKSAPSKEGYEDTSTLKARLQQVASSMTRRSSSGQQVDRHKIDRRYFQHMLQGLTSERRKQFLSLDKETQKKHFVTWMKRKREYEIKKKAELKRREQEKQKAGQSAQSAGGGKVNLSDINPFMTVPQESKPVKKESSKPLTAAQKKKLDAQQKAAMKKKIAARAKSKPGRSQSVDQRQQVLRQQQQRLLLLRHASKCEAGTPGHPKECPATKHCAQMKSLWQHIAKCKDQHCKTPHCVSSRYVLSHYHRCKDQKCSVCSPVRDAIQRHKEKKLKPDKVKKPRQKKALTKAQQKKLEAAQKKKAAADKKRAAGGGKKGPAAKKPRLTAAQKKKLEKGTAGRNTKIMLKKQVVQKVRRYSTSMITTFTRGQIEMHIKSLQQDFSSSYGPQELRLRLAPLLKKLIDDDYGWVFSNPVEPNKLNLPDYFDIVKRPMDLGIIKKNLEGNKYSTPEIFQRDVCQVFENAMMYNPEGEDVHTIAKRLKDSFLEEFEQALKKMHKDAKSKQLKNTDSVCAVCHGEDFMFETPVYMCNGKCSLKIRRNAHYYVDSSLKFHFCQSCYNELPKESTMVESQTVIIKSELKKKKHDEEVKEDWVQCNKCTKWVHQICGLYNPKLDKGPKAKPGANSKSAGKTGASSKANDRHEKFEFYCPQCLLRKMEEKKLSKSQRLSPKPSKSAIDLAKTNMTDYIEGFLNRRMKLLRKEDAEKKGVRPERIPMPEIIVRTILNREERLDVQDQMIRRYQKHSYPREHNYTSKCILMFQRIDGVDVLLFGMYVQEFDERCEGPNKRSVYISYLDSVKYFQPREWRTAIWHEVIISYFSYARERGFAYGFLWACPPLKGDDYILYCKPTDQKTPKADRLKAWYYALLERAEKNGLVYNIDTMWNQYFGNKVDPMKIVEKTKEVASAPSAASKAATEQIVNSKSKRIPKPKRTAAGMAHMDDKPKRKSASKKKEDKTIRDDACAVELPYFSGDYWPGIAEDLIKKISTEESEKQDKAIFEAQLASAGPRQKRRKKEDGKTDAGPSDAIAENSPYGVHDKDTPDQLMKKLGEVMSQMKDDFIVIQLLPRCWCCEEYILTSYRYVCKRSRERGHKKYILCQDCFDCIPEANKAVVDTISLVNSVTTSVDKKTLLDQKSFNKGRYRAAARGRPSTAKVADAGKSTAGKAEVKPADKNASEKSKPANVKSEVGASAEDGATSGEGTGVEALAIFKKKFGKHAFDGRREFIRERLPSPIPKPSRDPNPKCVHEIFTTRQQFLSMCQGNHYQYDQLRRAKHASMMVLYHLHNPNVQAFIHNCNNCHCTIEGDLYRCTEKKCDFDLCTDCYEKKKVKHEHPLKKQSHTHENAEQRQRNIALHIHLLVHASQCRNDKCPSGNCKKMKNLLRHGQTCQKKVRGGCNICRRIWALLQIHARGCRAPYGKCPVPRCRQLRDFQRKARIQEQNRRRNHFTGLVNRNATAAAQSQAAASSSSTTTKETKTSKASKATKTTKTKSTKAPKGKAKASKTVPKSKSKK
jgi:hypothetical protein